MKRLDFIKSLGLLPAAFILPKAVSDGVGEGQNRHEIAVRRGEVLMMRDNELKNCMIEIKVENGGFADVSGNVVTTDRKFSDERPAFVWGNNYVSLG